MTTRTQAELHEVLLTITDHVYFQPPETVKLIYPCIIYERSKIGALWANNRPYKFNTSYQVTVIDKDPESEIIDKLAELPLCLHNSHYVADDLNHDVFTLYY
mgnify:CR=1 FL=1